MIRINESRLQEGFYQLAKIGATEDAGVNRPALGEAHLEARRWFHEQARESDLDAAVDGAGNYSAILQQPQAQKTLLIGSHLDSVPNGGRYDGALGVVAALEVLRTLKDTGMELPYHLEAIDFTDEESYLMSDADMLFRKPLEPLHRKLETSDASIIFRDGVWDGVVYEHLKVACGLVSITRKGEPLIREWNRIMHSEKSLWGHKAWEWWWDQISLLEATRRVSDLRYSSIEPELYIDRDFNDQAPIWSANKPPKDYMYKRFSEEFESLRRRNDITT